MMLWNKERTKDINDLIKRNFNKEIEMKLTEIIDFIDQRNFQCTWCSDS